jgi:uracil-DNA glycosylase family 4
MLKQASINCFPFLERQIAKLKVKILIPLGEHPTRILLKNHEFKKFSDVVGRVFEMEIEGEKILVIPIYHPSPINPKGYRDNVAIFKEINSML